VLFFFTQRRRAFGRGRGKGGGESGEKRRKKKEHSRNLSTWIAFPLLLLGGERKERMEKKEKPHVSAI